ncbi:MAG: uroporphyrinogen decarboxylase family protein [Candidatus Hodarchaeales archaeon]
MKPIDRVVTTIQNKEPDKVPLFLFFTVHGAKELDLSFPEYYNSGLNVAKGQLKLQEKFNHDCLNAFFYAAVEHKAFGGDVSFKKNGPPVSGKPVFNKVEDLLATELPTPEAEVFDLIIKAQKQLFEEKGDEIPIINSIIAPFSLPIMLLGFEKWIDIIVFHPEIAKEVVKYLSGYSIPLANYLLENHATALGYFNPLASPQMVNIERDYKNISFDTCKNFFSSLKGLAVYGLAGARTEEVLKYLIEINVPGVMISSSDNLGKIKLEYGSKINLIGNLNNIEMIRWDKKQTEEEIKRCVEEGATGGGYILSDHHGDLPLLVKDETLYNIVEMRNLLGNYS